MTCTCLVKIKISLNPNWFIRKTFNIQTERQTDRQTQRQTDRQINFTDLSPQPLRNSLLTSTHNLHRTAVSTLTKQNLK